MTLLKSLWLFFKNSTKAQKIFFLLQIVSGLFAIITAPKVPGLYVNFLQLLPIAFALPFFIPKCGFNISIRKKFPTHVFFFSAVSFLTLAIDYLLKGHGAIILLALSFIPAGLIWIFRFIRWNFYCVKTKECLIALAFSSIAWGFYALAFPPLPLGPGAMLLLVPWFLVLSRHSKKACLFATFWAGILYNTINYYWIYNVMKVGPAGMILFGLFLLICYFSLYNVIAAAVFVTVRDLKFKNKKILLILFPLFYAGLEMTRTYGDFAFPWSHLGYAFGNQLELLQALSYIGIFGYTAIILYANMAVAYGILHKKYALFAVPLLILAFLFIHGKWVFSKESAKPFYEGKEKAPRIALVQPSIPQTAKWSKAYLDSVVNKTLLMANDSIQENSVDLIVLAETAVPDHLKRQPLIQRRIQGLSIKKNAPLLTGALDYQRLTPTKNSLKRYDVYNAAFLFHTDNSLPSRYIKKHLVPFSERIPFDDVFPILNYVDFGEGDFVAGTHTPVYKPFSWTPYICYDAIFGDLVREAIGEGSRLMVNITNDGWFGKSTAPYQHLNLIRYRAIEHGYPVARVANSGITTFIDQYGHYSERTSLFTDRVLISKIPLRSRDTLYFHIGDYVEKGLLIFLLAYLIFMFAQIKTTKGSIPRGNSPT